MSPSSLTTLFRPWDQRINLPCRSRIQTRQNVFEPLAKADTVRFACRGERIQDSETLSASFTAGKEAVLSDDRNSPPMRGIVKGLFAEMSFFFQMKAFADLKTLAVLLPFAFKNRLPSQTHDIVRRGRRNLTNEFFTGLASHDSRGIPRSPDGTLSDKIVKIFLKVKSEL